MALSDRLLASAFAAFLGCIVIITSVQGEAAEVSFDSRAYSDMVDTGRDVGIPVGTRITLSNWQRYKNFMPVYLQILFSGQYPLKIGPDFNIVVSSTEYYPYPRQFLADTEKFANQVKLVQVSEGGYTISPSPDHFAGLPFGLKPTEPLKAYKVLYNWFLTWTPHIAGYIAGSRIVDRFGNTTTLLSHGVTYGLSHLSEPDTPMTLPYSHGYLSSQRFSVVLPEESKYTTELQLQRVDPAADPELYVFLPSLRRSLRLSSAAKCSPELGTDFIADDSLFQYPSFKVSLLGEKRLLFPIMDGSLARGGDPYITQRRGFQFWTRPEVTHWQLRDVDVLLLEPLPVLGNYCYGRKVVYIDQDGFYDPLTEDYDHGFKYWRAVLFRLMPMPYLGQTILSFAYGDVANGAIDFLTSHQTVSWEQDITIGPGVPDSFQNAEIMAFPGSLAQINQ